MYGLCNTVLSFELSKLLTLSRLLVQGMLEERGHIYKGSYEGWYSVSDEAFLTEDEVKDGTDRQGQTCKVRSALFLFIVNIMLYFSLVNIMLYFSLVNIMLYFSLVNIMLYFSHYTTHVFNV